MFKEGLQIIPIEEIIVENRFREDLGDIEELARGIAQKGVLQPISVSTTGRLLAGGRRIAAAQKAGLTEIPALIRRSEDILDEREVELMENIYRKDMSWSERAKLEAEILRIKTAQNPNWTQRDQASLVDTSLGGVNRRLQLAEYIEAVPELAKLSTESEAWKAVKKMEEGFLAEALARQAEVRINNSADGDPQSGYFKAASKQYTIGDALVEMEKLVAGVAHFAEVDPPYAIGLEKRKARTKTDNKMSNYDEIPEDKYHLFLASAAEEVFRILSDNTFAVWWFGQEWYGEVLSTLIEVGFKVNPIPAIWYKGAQGQTNSPDTMLASSYETFFVARKGNPKLAKAGRSNVFHFNPLHPGRKIHPTEKPIELMVEILETFLFPGSRVLVPFLGSGVSLRACYRLNHSGFGWDKSKDHKKLFLARVNEDIALGVKPKLVKMAGD